jgi:bla regulator protein blaR1
MRTAGASSVAIVAVCTAFGQPPPPPAFEVASIKLYRLPANTFIAPPQTNSFDISGSRIDFWPLTLTGLIVAAYNVREDQVSGGPAWALEQGGDRYLINAKAPVGAPSSAEVRLMLQALLAERFNLKLRHETKDLPVYEVTVGKNRPKMKEVSADGPATVPPVFKGTMEHLLIMLRGPLDRPLIDKTGLAGTYEYTFDMRKLENARAAGRTDPAALTDTWLAAIQEQLGLRVEAKKAATDILVIDRADRPSGN